MADKQNTRIECGNESVASITSFDTCSSSFSSLEVQVQPHYPVTSYIKPGVLSSEDYGVSTMEWL
jgi:hypothetical protein